MSDAKFERAKPHLNIGIIGQTANGKTTLTAAISKVLADAYPSAINVERGLESIDNAPRDRQRGITINVAEGEFETPRRHYAYVDTPSDADFVKNMVTGAAKMDGAVLVVDAMDGPTARTREQVLLTKQLGVSNLVVALNKSDMVDEDILELVEFEIRELLSSQGFDGDNAPIVRVSGLLALEGDEKWVQSVLDLMEAVDESIPEPVPNRDKPFLMAIEDVFTITGRGTVVTGRAERGTLPIDSDVEIVGIRPTLKATVTGIEVSDKQLDEAWAGENLGLLLRGAERDDVERGQVVATPGSVTAHTAFEGTAYILDKAEGGRHHPFDGNYSPQFFFRTTDVSGVITLPEGTDLVMPGDTVQMRVDLSQPMAMEEGLGFAIREGGRTVGAGTITKLLAETQAPDGTPVVTVWYGTNRLPEPGGPRQGFQNGKDDAVLHVGTCSVHVPKSHRFGSVGTPWWRKLWKLDFTPDGALELADIAPAESIDSFAGQLREVLASQVEENRALLYLHGYNTSFEGAAIRAAQIATDLNPPGITTFFSWPSHGEFEDYPGDSQRAAASEKFFIDYLQVLVDRAGVERIDLLIHSMGNQVFARSVQQMLLSAATKHIRFGVILMAAPDIDTVLFKQIAPQYCSAAKKATMYVSTRDVALRTSSFIQQGSRAGYCPPITVVSGIDTVEVSDIDFSAFGHGYYAEAAPVMYDMKLLIEGVHDPDRRMRMQPTKTTAGEGYWRIHE